MHQVSGNSSGRSLIVLSRRNEMKAGILLDEEQFKAVSGSYGSTLIPDIPVGGNKQVLQANGGNDIEMKKNGYLYVCEQ